ncbi:MAG: acyl-CoA dehydrogenase family protein [Myxococcota bacterium]|nr:acyl-CoA dehydrogenase family protein [Myxococcota bacterium]
MDFRVNEDQQALREGIRSFCEGRVTVDHLRELEKTGGFDPELWGALAEMGVFGLRLAEDQGGVGLRMADAVLVFEELARALVPGPVLWSHLAAGLIDGAAEGSAVVGGLDLSAGSQAPLLLEHLDALDALIVLHPDRVESFAPKSLDAKPVATPTDPLTPVWEVASLTGGETIAGSEEAHRMRLGGTILAAAQLLGIAEATLALSVEYSRGREQFNRPVGSFQALKHIMADGFTRQEAARAAVYAAGATFDDPVVGDVVRAASSAKAVAGDAAWKNARACIQIHGGMGFTWEIPAHYYLKRAWVFESVFGGVDEHADALADGIAAAVA